MSDALLNTFLHYGTNAERLAFTPSPPVVSGVTVPVDYLWYETDTNNYYLYTTAWHGPYGAATSGTVTHTGTLTAGQLVVGNGTADLTVGNLSGDVSTSGSGTTTIGALKVATGMIQAGAVTYAKIQNVSANAKLLGSSATGSGAAPSELTLGTGLSMSGSTLNATAASITASMGLVIDGGGSTITTGIKGDLYVPVACTITAVTMLADQSGSIVVDIWKVAYASYPATVANTITASAPPTITTAVKSQDTTLTGWTKSVSAGDTIRFNVNSVTSLTRLALALTITVP